MDKLIILLCFLPMLTFGQTPDSVTVVPRHDFLKELEQPGSENGAVRLHASPAIQSLLKWHVNMNEKQKTFPGYRIQIYSVSSYGCNIEALKEMRNKFEETFQDIPAYLKYFDPDFKIRVGNFHSRLECIPALNRIRKLYPSSYPVKTEITLEELKRIPMQDIPREEPQDLNVENEESNQ